MARDSGATLPGTAPLARGYLLVDYPGPWPGKAFDNCPADPGAGKRIVERTSTQGVRPLFIRRPGSPYAPTKREFAWAYVDAAARTTTWHEPVSLSTIAEVDWPHHSGASSTPQAQSLYLVCTHGRRDQCCATRGRPVAASFAQLRPKQTWECSHVGGHRLASVVIALPQGAIYGLVDPEDASAIVAAAEGGQVHLPRLRGCSLDEPAVQVAKTAVLGDRSEANPWVLHTAACERVRETSQSGAAKWRVELHDVTDPGLAWIVEVIRRPTEPAPASCGKDPTETFIWVVSGRHRTVANSRV